jgi:hypothetical protein
MQRTPTRVTLLGHGRTAGPWSGGCAWMGTSGGAPTTRFPPAANLGEGRTVSTFIGIYRPCVSLASREGLE